MPAPVACRPAALSPMNSGQAQRPYAARKDPSQNRPICIKKRRSGLLGRVRAYSAIPRAESPRSRHGL